MKIKVRLTTSSLGDTIGAVCQVDRFQKLTNNEVGFFINPNFVCLFEKSYPNIKFNPVDFCYDLEKPISFYFDRPLQKGFSDDLNLNYEECNTKIDNFLGPRQIKQKYITISTHSTHQARYWNNKSGWNELIKYLKKTYNISSVCIDKNQTFGVKNYFNPIPKEAIDRCGMSLQQCVNYINHSEFHIGTSNGLSWLAHGLNKHVVLISNVTKNWCEFSNNVTRIYNEKICNGCLNEEKFDDKNWLWCPRNKNFECTREIKFIDIKDQIDQCIKELKIA
jgi:autotransporter strand-loop-strand O-heptosyltransferase